MKPSIFRIVAAAFLLLAAAPGLSARRISDPVLRRILDSAARENRTMHHLDILCNRFGGRPLGSDAYTHAADWAVWQFRQWGLQAEKEWVCDLPVGFNRGPWFGRSILGDEALHFATPSYTAGTKGLQRGHVVLEPRTRADLERMKKTLKGAWVLIGGTSRGWPVDWSENGDRRRAEIIARNDSIDRANAAIRRENRESGANKPLIPRIEEPALFYREMVEAGILGIIQSAPVPIAALYDRNNLFSMSWDRLPAIPDIKLDERQYAAIRERVERREYVELEFDIRNHFYMGPVACHNVIAVLPGTRHPDEYILCGGHLDSFDSATGGVDCGTGVAPTMEAARLLAQAGARPDRTIVFALWAGEEFGLLGSTAWVEQHPDKLPGILNFFNRDGGPTVANSLTVPPAWYEMLEPVVPVLNAVNPDFPFTLQVSDRYPVKRPETAGGSDHAPFVVRGVPVLSFGTADPKGYDFQYREIWHTDRDRYDKSIPEYMEHTAVVNAVMLWFIANLPERLPAGAVYLPE